MNTILDNFILRIKYLKEVFRFGFNTQGDTRFAKKIFKKIKKGFYLDCGCYHPFKGSQTKFLYDKGWKGICLDISEDTIKLFKIYRPLDLCLNIALFTRSEKRNAYFEKNISTVTSLDKNFLNKIGREVRFKKQIQTITLKDLRKKYKINEIDFLKIDCENIDEQIILSARYLDLNAKYLSIECLPDLNKQILDKDVRKVFKKSSIYKKLCKKYKIIDSIEYTFLFERIIKS